MADEKEPLLTLSPPTTEDGSGPRRRRKSSLLGSEVRLGDTRAPALASSRIAMHANDSSSHPDKKSKKRRGRSLLHTAHSAMIKHTYLIPAVMLLAFVPLYAINPSPSNPIYHFIFLSYPFEQPTDGSPLQYGKGLWDIAFVVFYTIVLSFTREFIMQVILRPLARWFSLSRSKQARFMEQMYSAIYFGCLCPFGMYVMSRTPVWYYNTYGMYENFPHRTHEAIVKFYYLFQAAFWAQQAIVMILGLEKQRKDYKELCLHHVVSLTLIALSYRFHFTYVGLAVFTTHDISDFFLATSKTLNYIDSPIVGPYFFLFMCVWIYCRHFINIRILISLFFEFRTVGPFELDWENEQYKCLLAQGIATTLLSALQTLNLIWLSHIIRIAYRFIRYSTANDDRSEDESDESHTSAEKASLLDKKTTVAPPVEIKVTDSTN
ncbi:sphingosine N-acyltransferase lag1 [Ceratocystis pirilliformis]|uniref:Sphingosine N-acyltransferase lag1 n=1 Tax=Ceratocystis pirilliformis TaxID=259994 RepID=A0ABR3Z2W2_9PEZI